MANAFSASPCWFGEMTGKEILLTSSRQGVQWNKACREEGEKGRGVLGEREGLALTEDRIYEHTDVKSL
jgi:hypothetical protein